MKNLSFDLRSFLSSVSPPAGHNAVHVHMVAKLLVPCIERAAFCWTVDGGRGRSVSGRATCAAGRIQTNTVSGCPGLFLKAWHNGPPCSCHGRRGRACLCGRCPRSAGGRPRQCAGPRNTSSKGGARIKKYVVVKLEKP